MSSFRSGPSEPRVPVRTAPRLEVTRSKLSYASTAPNPLTRTFNASGGGSYGGTTSALTRISAGSRSRGGSMRMEYGGVPKGTIRQTVRTPAPFLMRKTTTGSMMGRVSEPNAPGKYKSVLPQYDSLSDPAMSRYWSRKFGWTVASTPTVIGSSRPRMQHPPPAAGDIEYNLELKTGDVSGASSTSEQKAIQIFGTSGNTPLIVLGSAAAPTLANPKQGRKPFQRGKLDMFAIRANSVGKIQRIKLQNMSKNKKDGWFCEYIVITRRAPGKKDKKYYAEFRQWLSLFEDPCALSCSRDVGPVPQGETQYMIRVKTGEENGSGTTANVSITLYGTKGQSQATRLVTNKHPNLQKGCDDVFTIVTARLGSLTRARIEHNNFGADPSWFCEWVMVTHSATQKKYKFPFNCWLARDRGTGNIHAEIGSSGELGAAGETQYTVEVYTGDVQHAGVKANVSITLYGESGGHTPDVPLVPKSGKGFQRGKVETFDITVPDVGGLERIRIGHDDSVFRATWFLEKVRIISKRDQVMYEFGCGRWLSRSHDDGHVSRELTCNNQGAWSATPFHIHIHTGDIRDASTSANVSCELIGKTGKSGTIPLENHTSNFNRNRVDIFKVETADIGELQKISIRHDNTGSSADWYIEKIWIECPKLGNVYHASVQKWFSSDTSLTGRDGKTEREIEFDPSLTQKFRPKGIWTVTTWTADKLFASTDANVFLVGYGISAEDGKLRRSDVIPLTSKTDLFERGQIDKFKIEMDALGTLRKIRIFHDNTGIAPGWLLEKVEMVEVDTNTVYLFEPSTPVYLSRRDDDGEIIRELPTSAISVGDDGPLKSYVPPEMKEYTVRVFTGRKNGAGTDANVHIVIFGSLGDTGERPLRKSSTHRDKFENGHEDVFIVKAVDLGALDRIKIGHDNSGIGPSWYLDKVTIETEGIDPAEFVCNRWLAKKQDDGLIERTLYRLGSRAATTYTITVKTGDVQWAGTDANVYIKLYGEIEDSGKLMLRKSESHRDKFERGRTDVFKIEAADFGKLEKIRIGHDGTGIGSGWFLDEVIVEVKSTGHRYTFTCGRWLSTGADDKKIERELLIDKVDEFAVALKPHEDYICHVHTADKRFAGTDAKVFVQIYGKDGKTDEIRLTNKTDNFERGQVDQFRLEFEEVGAPYKIRVWHDNSGLGSDWLLDKIVLHNVKLNMIYTFDAKTVAAAAGKGDGDNFGLWLSKKNGINHEITVTKVEKMNDAGETEDVGLEEFQKLEEVSYCVEVVTADVRGAGTDANVFMCMYGERGDSGERKLDKSSEHRDKFERGRTDKFTINCVSLGALNRLKIWHDNRGLNASWKLFAVNIIDPTTETTYRFPCDDWLSKDKGSKLTTKELGVAKDVLPEFDTKAVVTKYHVEVYTSDIKYAGTDATVSITIYGENGDTGKVDLLKSETHRDKFERGNMDKFVVEAIDIGEIQKIKIGHNDGGIGSDWHCDKILIDVPLIGKTWEFVCDQWFAKSKDDGLIERELYPAKDKVVKYEKKTPYEVQVYTSDISGAGTDRQISMSLYGRGPAGEERSADFNFAEATSKTFQRGAGTAMKQGTGDNKEMQRIPPDTFQFELPDVGLPYKLRVTAEKGSMISRTTWHLHKVVVLNKREGDEARYEFLVDKWISDDKSKDGGLLSREFPLTEELSIGADGKAQSIHPAAMLDPITYTVSVETGNVKDGATDANVFLTLFGENGDSGERKLAKSDNWDKFEKGKTDTFELSDIVDLGDLLKVRIRHDNSALVKNSWFCQRVVVKAGDSVDEDGNPRQWEFPCGQWLSTKRGDKQISRDLPVFVDPAIAAVKLKKAHAAVKRQEKQVQQLEATKGVPNFDATALAVQQKQLELLQKKAMELEATFQYASTGVVSRGENATYKIAVVTGSNANSGTKANVFIELMGEKLSAHHREEDDRKSNEKTDSKVEEIDGVDESKLKEKTYQTSSGLLDLRGTGTPFRKGQTDMFEIEALDVGRLTKLSIGHDSTDSNSGWYLERVDITVFRRGKPSPPVSFPCSAWLVGQGGVVPRKTLIASSSSAAVSAAIVPSEEALASGVRYTIHVHTGDLDKAGTDANVFLVAFGAGNNKSSELSLKNSLDYSDKFERGHVDRFQFKQQEIGPELGELTHIRIWHDGRGIFKNSWFLGKVVIVDEMTQNSFEFPCDKWLSKSHDDKQTLRELTCSNEVTSGYLTEYTIDVAIDRTSDPSRVGIVMELVGSLRRSDLMTLDSVDGPFQPGEVYKFDEKIGSLGDVMAAKVRLSKSTKDEQLVLSEVKVTEKASGTSWIFRATESIASAKKFITLDQSVVEEGDILKRRSRKSVNYEISTVTSDIKNAGTDANVICTLFGEHGDTGPRKLSKSSTYRDKFERNHTDVFMVEALDLGKLEKLVIGHDSSGWMTSSSWHLDEVIVKRMDNNEEVHFPCNMWLSKKHDDKKTERELYASL